MAAKPIGFLPEAFWIDCRAHNVLYTAPPDARTVGYSMVSLLRRRDGGGVLSGVFSLTQEAEAAASRCQSMVSVCADERFWRWLGRGTAAGLAVIWMEIGAHDGDPLQPDPRCLTAAPAAGSCGLAEGAAVSARAVRAKITLDTLSRAITSANTISNGVSSGISAGRRANI